MAERVLSGVVNEAEGRWQVRCAVEHRLGQVDAGVTSIVIAVASPHRADAFEASRWLMDAIKERVPIWKKEFCESGTRWVEGSEIVPSDET
jgi:molybdopterin synthase catalytic subunit